MSAGDLERLRNFAKSEDLALGRAAVRLMRLALQPHRSARVEPVRKTATESQGLAEELALHNLIATEQVIQLLERIVRHGPGAADEVLVEAGRAAQRRLAAGHDATERGAR
jgi:hypothetical protein